jgi:HD superfamily phosphohydrolase
MIVFDPLYGRFQVSSLLSTLTALPEVRRLSQIRLLNTLTPSLATLGEIRRYSHTLGVLFLSQQNSFLGFSSAERDAFQASILLHDIGTPPFAHLFEYQLRDRTRDGWNHENIIRDILWGTHAPENTASQIYAGQTICFRNSLDKLGVDTQLVEDIVTGQHPLSRLLFGTLDLDNLDNVARMGFALGIREGAEIATSLARQLHVNRNTSGTGCPVEAKNLVEKWARLRRHIYDILVFDGPTVAAQAVLSSAIEELLVNESLTQDDWVLTDEQLLRRLAEDSGTKDRINLEYLGRLPQMAFSVQFADVELTPDTRNRLRQLAEASLKITFPSNRSIGYTFLDNGTFEKELRFRDPTTSAEWNVGKTSQSIVVYGFVSCRDTIPIKRCNVAYRTFLETVNIASAKIVREQIGQSTLDDGQQSFDFAD